MKGRNYLFAIICAAFIATTTGCSKEKNDPEEKIEVQKKSENGKLIKFLSITLGVTVDEITVDEKNNAFIIRSHSYSIDEISKIHATSNEYQAKFEN